jgi:hypothetical protein
MKQAKPNHHNRSFQFGDRSSLIPFCSIARSDLFAHRPISPIGNLGPQSICPSHQPTFIWSPSVPSSVPFVPIIPKIRDEKLKVIANLLLFLKQIYRVTLNFFIM